MTAFVSDAAYHGIRNMLTSGELAPVYPLRKAIKSITPRLATKCITSDETRVFEKLAVAIRASARSGTT